MDEEFEEEPEPNRIRYCEHRQDVDGHCSEKTCWNYFDNCPCHMMGAPINLGAIPCTHTTHTFGKRHL